MPPTRKHLLSAALADRVVEVQQIDLPAGQATGLHVHRGPVLGYIAAGTVRFQIDGQAIQTLNAGDAFYEPADTRIQHFDNASATQPATFIAFYLLADRDQELITMLKQ
jgi:quercetin dioxygenase-like cupin family protein